MNISTTVIPQHTIDTLAKGLYKEATQYGFERQDILRFVNSLLTLSMAPSQEPAPLKKDDVLQKEHLTACKES